MAVGVTPQTVQRRWEHLSEASLAVGETSASNWPTCDTAWSELLCARLSQCGKPTSPTPEGDGVEKDAQGRGESSFGPCADEEHGEGLLRSARGRRCGAGPAQDSTVENTPRLQTDALPSGKTNNDVCKCCGKSWRLRNRRCQCGAWACWPAPSGQWAESTTSPRLKRRVGPFFFAPDKDTFARKLIFELVALHTGIGDRTDTRRASKREDTPKDIKASQKKANVLEFFVDRIFRSCTRCSPTILEPLPVASCSRRPLIQWVHPSYCSLCLVDIPAQLEENWTGWSLAPHCLQGHRAENDPSRAGTALREILLKTWEHWNHAVPRVSTCRYPPSVAPCADARALPQTLLALLTHTSARRELGNRPSSPKTQRLCTPEVGGCAAPWPSLSRISSDMSRRTL